MVQKPLVRNWMREAFAEGKKDAIPAEALKALEAEKSAPKKDAKKPEKDKD